MLKKNLHFFTRCTLSAIIIVCLLFGSACRYTDENYLSFLDGEIKFGCTLEKNSREIAEADIEYSNGVLMLKFTYPKALSGTVLRVTPESAALNKDGHSLSDAAIPDLWLSVYDMLSKGKTVTAVTTENGITEIHTEDDGGTFDYKTDSEGRLISIESADLKLNVKTGE